MMMNEAKKELVIAECQRISDELQGILAVVIASQDGFDVANYTAPGMDSTKIAAMASSISAIGAVVSSETAIGGNESVTVKTQNGFAYIITIAIDGVDYILNVIANQNAILAQVVYQCSELKRRLQ